MKISFYIEKLIPTTSIANKSSNNIENLFFFSSQSTIKSSDFLIKSISTSLLETLSLHAFLEIKQFAIKTEETDERSEK